MIKFTDEEIEQVPPELRSLVDQYPLSFDNWFEAVGEQPMSGPFQTLEIYFDDELQPAVAMSDGSLVGLPSTDRPTCITLLADSECAYFQVGDRILLDRFSASVQNVYENQS